MQKNIKKIIIAGGIISVMFALPFFAFAITDVLTGGATNVTDTGATLSGSANPAGVSTSGYFRYSAMFPPPIFCKDIYGSNMKSTPERGLGSVNIPMTFTKDIAGLFPGTTYYYCAIASNENEINYTGEVNSFTTNNISASDVNGTPQNSIISIITKPATIVSSTSVYLNGFYNSNFFSSETWFEYIKKSNVPTLSKSAEAITGILNNTQTAKISNTGSLSKATAVKTTSTINWIKVDTKYRSEGSADKMEFLLTGLAPNTEYQFRAGMKNLSSSIAKMIPSPAFYGNTLTFRTPSSDGNISPGDVSNQNQNNQAPLSLGQTATPPVDATVHYHEGVETVFARQIIASPDIAEKYGYVQGTDLNAFAWNLADLFARKFGYVNSKGKEIRISKPDIAAYELRLTDGSLTVYEYYNKKIIHIQKLSSTLRNKYNYEYYFNKK